MRNDLVERKIRIRRESSKKFLEFEEKLGLDLIFTSLYFTSILNTKKVGN